MQVAIVLHEHQATTGRMWRVGEIIKQTGLRNKVPVTFSMSGMTIDKLGERQPDVCRGIQAMFAKRGWWNPVAPEIVISTQHNNPLILPAMPLKYWGTYLDYFAAKQVDWSKRAAAHNFERNPRGFFPSEMLFAPAAAHMLQHQGMDYCLIPGEFLGDDRSAKGRVYHIPGQSIRLLPRVNEFRVGQPEWSDAHALKEALKGYAHAAGIDRVVVGCDLGEFTGLYHEEGRGGIPLQDGVARLVALRDYITLDPDMELVNCGAIVDSHPFPEDIYRLYGEHGSQDPHHHITTWMNGAGDLSGVYDDEVHNRIEFVKRFQEEIGQGHDRELYLQQGEFFHTSGMERMMDW